MEVYVDDIIVKSRTDVDRSHDLRKMFDILWAFSIKLNPRNVCLEYDRANFWVHDQQSWDQS